MDRFKYIIDDIGCFAIVPAFMEHDVVAAHMKAKGPGGPIVGAGFISMGSDGSIHCYGKSQSLKIASRSEVDEREIMDSLKQM